MLSSNVLLRAGDLLVVIVAARRLSVEQFGNLMLVFSFYSLFRLAGDGGMQHLLVRDMAQDRARAADCFSDALGFQAVWSTLLVIVYVGTVLTLGYSGEILVGLFIALLAVVPDNLALPGMSAIQASERQKYLLFVNGTTSALRVVASLVVLQFSDRFLPLVVCMVLSRVLGFIVVQFLVTRRTLAPPFRTTSDKVKTLTWRLLPFLAITLVSAVFLRVDSIVLSSLAGESAVAMFSVGMRLTEPLILVAGSFALGIYPILASAFHSRHDFARLFAGTLRATMLVGLLVIGIGDTVAPRLLVWIFGQRYVASVPVLKVLLWYVVIFAVEQQVGRVLLVAGRQRANLKVISLGSVLVFILLFALVPVLGPTGAALADTLALTTMLAIELTIVSRIVPEMDIKRGVLVPFIGLGTVWAAGQWAAQWSWGAQLGATTGLSVAIVMATGLVRAGDIGRLQAAAVSLKTGRTVTGMPL